MEKIKQFIKTVGRPVLYVVVGFLLGATVYTAYAVWNDTVTSGQPITDDLWNDVVNKLIELDNRMYTEEITPQPPCDWNGTSVIADRIVWGNSCTGCCSGLSETCFGSCRIRDVVETEMTCDGTEVTGITQTAVSSGCACTAGCLVGDDDESQQDLEFYREMIKEGRKALIENGKTEKVLH